MTTVDPERVRRVAVRAAAAFLGPQQGTPEDVIHTAEIFAAYIEGGAPAAHQVIHPRPDTASPHPQPEENDGQRRAQELAERAFKAASCREVQSIREEAAACGPQPHGVLKETVSLGQGYGPLEDYLRHQWGELFRRQTARSDLGLDTAPS